MTHVDLFSGIVGFALAARWNGIKTVVFCEQDKFCQKIINKNFPGVPIEPDIKTFDGTKYTGAFILTGGVPCQPASCAGKRRGTDDDRWLWPETFRVVAEVKPKWVILENVRGLLTLECGLVFDNLLAELETIGYETTAFIIPACAVNAPHRRDRVWIVANRRCEHGERSEVNGEFNRPLSCEENASLFERSTGNDGQGVAPDTESGESGEQTESEGRENISRRNQQVITDTGNEGLQGSGESTKNGGENCGRQKSAHGSIGQLSDIQHIGQWQETWLEVATRLCTLDDGLPNGLPRPRGWRNAALKAVGNAIVPQVASEIMKAILQTEQMINFGE